SLSLTAQVSVTESAVFSLTAQLNGHAPVSASFFRIDPLHFAAFIPLSGATGLISGTNTLIVRALDFDRPPQTGSASVSFTYVDPPPPPPVQVDVWPIAYEVTQAIDNGPQRLKQSDFSSGAYRPFVPTHPQLLRGKRTLIRIYGAATGTTSPVIRVPATMRVERDNCTSNCTIAGGLAPMLNATIANPNGIIPFPFSDPL